MTSKSAALLLGVIFIAVGLLGFIPNPVVGTGSAIIHADLIHNWVHIVTGAVFIVAAVMMPGNASLMLKVFGVVYFLIGVWGMVLLGDDGLANLLGILHVNAIDNYLHLALGVVNFLAGMLKETQGTPA